MTRRYPRLRRAALQQALVSLFALHAFALPASAQLVQPLRIDATAERMRVDGMLNEWKGARFSELGRADGSVRYALASADSGLYLAAEVNDERLVLGEHGDVLVLSLAFPTAQAKPGWHTSQVSLFPGAPGSKARALLQSDGATARAAPSISVVEGPLKSGVGYAIEAFVPWAALVGAELWEQGRGALRFVDVDGKGVARTLETARGRAAELPPLVLGQGHPDLLGSFMEAHQLVGTKPRYDFRADVAGDARPERVVLVDRYVVVYGPGYHGGESSNYYALPFEIGGALKHAELRDLTGDGHPELLVTLRQLLARGAREVWLVLSLDEAAIAQRFAVEQRRELAIGFVEATVEVLPAKKGRKVPSIELKAGRAHGLDAASYHEPEANDVTPILLPWGELEARSFAFDGEHFVSVGETRRPAQLASASASTQQSRAVPAVASLHEPAGESASEAVLAAFKRQRGLASSERPSRTLRANVLPGQAQEQVDLFGGLLVLTGPEVGQGTAYVTYALPVDDARDVLELRATDVTSDDEDELLVRVRQPLTGAQGVTRELLLVLRASDPRSLSRALLVEVARRQGTQAIDNRVLVKDHSLYIEPGVASGWTQKSYPFTNDPIAPAARLLMPWLDQPQRYRFVSPNLVAVPEQAPTRAHP